MKSVNVISVSGILISLYFTSYHILKGQYAYGIGFYFICIAIFFTRSFVKYKLEQNDYSDPYSSNINRGYYLAEKLYALFRSNNTDIIKDIYITEICKLYINYKKYHKIVCNNDNYSTFCAYLDFEYYANEYLNNLPKF